MQKKIIICIPCYNEQVAIVKTISEVQKALDKMEGIEGEIVVVNDCSLDQSKEEVLKTDATLIDLAVNLGIGGAVQSGVKYAVQEQADVMIQVDGDGQHDPAYLSTLLAPILSQQANVVVGSRYINKEGFQSTFMRQAGIRYFSKVNKWLSGVSILDSTSGYRAFDKKALALMAGYYPETYPEPEAIMMFGLQGLTLKEMPVKMRSRDGGVSSIGAFSSVFYMFSVTLGVLFYYIGFKRKGK